MTLRPALSLLLAVLATAACTPAPPPAELAAASPAALPATAALPLSVGQPISLGAGGAAAAAEPAPVPNREIEAPPERNSDPLAPRIEPMVLRQDRPQGMTFGREHIRETAPDRSLETLVPGMRLPFDDVVPGARVRIPFE